jgi:hypothetical protein
MIRLGATADEEADLLICVLCGAHVCTVTTMQNGGSGARGGELLLPVGPSRSR